MHTNCRMIYFSEPIGSRIIEYCRTATSTHTRYNNVMIYDEIIYLYIICILSTISNCISPTV